MDKNLKDLSNYEFFQSYKEANEKFSSEFKKEDFENLKEHVDELKRRTGKLQNKLKDE
jgi:polyhydroxyalkanoate synthesis regulator phasin